MRLLDSIVFSGLWVAAAAGALVAATSLALGAGAVDPVAIALAVSGTFAVYGLDRLRDVERDADRAPLRSAFVLRWRGVLAAATTLAVAIAGASAFALAPVGLVVAAAAGGVGLLHRRLKQRVPSKGVYVTAVWLLVVLGLAAPAATARGGAWVWAGVLLGPPLLGNAIACSARDQEGSAARLGERRALRAARGLSIAGVAAGVLAPAALRPLGMVPFATLLALLGYRPSERYVYLVVDGALLGGGLLACALLAA